MLTDTEFYNKDIKTSKNVKQRNENDTEILFPKLPKELLISKKYKITEKELYEKDIKSIHDILTLHFDFWDNILEKYYYFKDKIVEYIIQCEQSKKKKNSEETSIHKISYLIIRIKKIMKEFLKYYQNWRQNEGCFSGSASATKCVAGHAHGWDCINRIFILESILFSALNYSTKSKMIDHLKFTREEIKQLISKNHCVIIFNKIPIHKWSARMLMLQLRSISQRWNHMYDFLINEHFRNALKKLVCQIQCRLYVIIDNASTDDTLTKYASIANAEGVLSESFNGKIICTPQNNCGMSSITSKGSWIENLILSSSRMITKIQNTIIMMDKIAPLSSCIYVHQLKRNFIPSEWKTKSKELEKSLLDKSLELLDTGQLQESLSKSLCPSLIGIDALVRVSDIFGTDRSTKIGYFEKSRNIAPTGMCLWLDSFLRYQSKDYIFDSNLSKYLHDMVQITLLHAFEIISKKDGNNPVGFMKKYFVRLECVKDIENIIFKDLVEFKTPFIVKMGANYIVCRAGNNIAIYCETICEALIVWAYILKKFNKWKIGDLNLKTIYKNIFKI